MQAIIVARFPPFDFSIVLGFPNVVPIMDEWGDCLPRFRGYEDDNCYTSNLLNWISVAYSSQLS
jgi:hypothetical protein